LYGQINIVDDFYHKDFASLVKGNNAIKNSDFDSYSVDNPNHPVKRMDAVNSTSRISLIAGGNRNQYNAEESMASGQHIEIIKSQAGRAFDLTNKSIDRTKALVITAALYTPYSHIRSSSAASTFTNDVRCLIYGASYSQCQSSNYETSGSFRGVHFVNATPVSYNQVANLPLGWKAISGLSDGQGSTSTSGYTIPYKELTPEGNVQNVFTPLWNISWK